MGIKEIMENRGGCKGLGNMSPGYWGRSIYQHIFELQKYEKNRALLLDKVIGSGLRTELWIGVDSGEQCSCYSEHHKAADRKCSSCHGVGLVPGYTKFGYETLWMSATDSDVTLTDVEVTNTFKSSKVQLTSTATTGTIESGDKSFSRTVFGSEWEYDVSSFIRIAGDSSITVEYSVDSGSTWEDIADLPTANPSSGTIRFKATLTRTSTSILSPLFEIIRARFSTIALNDQVDGKYVYGPWIYVTNSKPRQNYIKSEYGDLPNYTMNFWTVGLSSFDSVNYTENTQDELLEGPSVAFRFLDGALAGDRKYVMTDWQMSDPSGYQITIQTFTLRVADEVGYYSLIW